MTASCAWLQESPENRLESVQSPADGILRTLGRLRPDGAIANPEIARIRAALQRMRDGTYGECVRCGEEIAEARLETLPDTPLCRTCAAGA